MYKKLIIAVTGNPGTGKSTFSKQLSKITKIRNIEINDLAKRYKTIVSYDKSLNTNIIDTKKLSKKINNLLENLNENIILTGHLAADLKINYDIAIVLRLSLIRLAKRLETRNYPIKKIQEDLLAEAYDYCAKIKENSKEFYEIETAYEKRQIINYIFALKNKKHKTNKKDIEKIAGKEKEHFSELIDLINNKNKYKF
ncbi:MAG: AAA family ATPase [Candidatus Micrarchaeia archaeon]